MEIGVSTASLFERKNNEDALPLLDRLGIPVVEVFLTSFSEYGKEFASLLKERKGNIKINSVHILNTQFEPQLFSSHPRVKADAYAWLEKVMGGIRVLDAPYYTFHGTARIKRASRSGDRDDFSKMIQGFEELTAFCQQKGVTLCLENVEWATYNRPGVFKVLSNAIPELKGVLDIKQARISGFSYETYLQEMGNKLAYAHVSDIDENGNLCLPGKGIFDFETFFKRLLDVGFHGAILIEAYNRDYQDEKELKNSCDFLRESLDKVFHV